VTRGEVIRQHRALDGAEIGFALPREDLGDRRSLARLDQLVDVDRLPIQPLRQRAADRRLAGSHEADQIYLVCFHSDRLIQSARDPW
jgi:hypothetical protein